jgi:hypothetical protein
MRKYADKCLVAAVFCPPPAPCLATADYYGLEQTDLSAMNFARLVWAVMDERFAAQGSNITKVD